MNRQKLASEALDLSRTLIASVPFEVYMACCFPGITKQAFTKDDMAILIGLDVLVQMVKVGVSGEISGGPKDKDGSSAWTMEKLAPYVKRGTLSKIKAPAKAVGGIVMGLARVPLRDLTAVEDAWQSYSARELKTLSSGHSVPEALKYVANLLGQRVKSKLKQQTNRERLRRENAPKIAPGGTSQETSDELAMWDQLKTKILKTPDLMGPKGEPWGWIYFNGKAMGMSEAKILDVWNEAASRQGEEKRTSRGSMLHWVRKNRALLEQLRDKYLSPEARSQIKLAAIKGSYGSTPLLPFQREFFEFLSASA